MEDFKVLARGIDCGSLAAQMEAKDFFTANNIYNDYVASYKDAHKIFGLPQVVVSMLAKRKTDTCELWDVVKAEIC